MGDFTKTVLKTALANGLAVDAEWWLRGSTNVKCIDVSPDKTGDLWRKAYDKVSDLLPPGSVKTAAGECATDVQTVLNNWSPQNANADVVKDITQSFSNLFARLKGTPLDGPTAPARKADFDNFRNTGFSIMMTVSAGYDSAASKGDFKTTFNKVKLTTRCDSVYERRGDPPMDWRIDRSERADRYWLAKSSQVAKGLLEVSKDIGADLGTLENSDTKTDADAFGRLSENLDALNNMDRTQGFPGVAGMLFVEAVRRPLGILRGPGEQPNAGKPKDGGEVMSKVPSLQDVETLRIVADEHSREWRRKEIGDDK